MFTNQAVAMMGGMMALAACAFQITGYTHQPDLTRGPEVNRTTITVHWTDDVEVIGSNAGATRFTWAVRM
jgi:hypothetical protein